MLLLLGPLDLCILDASSWFSSLALYIISIVMRLVMETKLHAAVNTLFWLQTGQHSSDSSRQSTLTLRSRRRPRHPHHLYHHRHSSMSSQSPSPTRSRSRSRSRSRGENRIWDLHVGVGVLCCCPCPAAFVFVLPFRVFRMYHWQSFSCLMLGETYHKRFRSTSLCPCDVFQVLINSFCWFWCFCVFICLCVCACG